MLNRESRQKLINNVFICILLFTLLTGLILTLKIPQLKQFVFAFTVQGDYSPVRSTTVQMQEWNWLAEDFLIREGDTMPANFDINNRITNLLTDSASSTSVATVGYVKNRLLAAAGGDVYTNWGKEVCERIEDRLLYAGYQLTQLFGQTSGGDNPICLKKSQAPSDIGPAFSGVSADYIYPPKPWNIPDSIITWPKAIKCAVCYRPLAACYINYGSFNCTGSFNVKLYEGYVLGPLTKFHSNSNERTCINKSFDNLAPDYTGQGAQYYASRIEDNFGLSGYNTSEQIPCAVCCND